jgi:hypothetical protein
VIGGRVLDTSALLDAGTGHTLYARALITVAVQEGIVLAVPATCLADAWAQASPQVRPFLDLLADRAVVVIDALDGAAAVPVGILAAPAADPASLPSVDLPAAHAVHLARTRGGWPIVTADPDRLRAIDDEAPIEELPI